MSQTYPRIVELVGPAGAGKTTIRRNLIARHPKIRFVTPPDFHKFQFLPFFAGNLAALLPLFLRLAMTKTDRTLTAQEHIFMATARGWSGLLVKMVRKNDDIVLTDQGPVYFLTRLALIGPSYLKSTFMQKWWENTYQKWANTMDLVIYLDAPDTTLFERINTREKGHGVRGMPLEETSAFLVSSRQSLQQMMQMLSERNPRMKIARINTDGKTVDQVYEEVVCALEQTSPETGKSI